MMMIKFTMCIFMVSAVMYTANFWWNLHQKLRYIGIILENFPCRGACPQTPFITLVDIYDDAHPS